MISRLSASAALFACIVASTLAWAAGPQTASVRSTAPRGASTAGTAVVQMAEVVVTGRKADAR